MSDDTRVWDLATCRRECGRLQAAYSEAMRDLATTGSELARITYAIELERKRTATLQRSLDESHHRERVLAAELADCKRQGEAGHTRFGTVTPLRPPKGKR